MTFGAESDRGAFTCDDIKPVPVQIKVTDHRFIKQADYIGKFGILNPGVNSVQCSTTDQTAALEQVQIYQPWPDILQRLIHCDQRQ